MGLLQKTETPNPLQGAASLCGLKRKVGMKPRLPRQLVKFYGASWRLERPYRSKWLAKHQKKCPAIIDGLGTLLKAVNAAIANGQVVCFSVTTSREP